MFSKRAADFLVNRATKTDIIIITVVVFSIAGLLYYQDGRITRARRSVTHSYEVRSHVQAVYTKVKELESGQRGFLLTGNPVFIAPFQNVLHAEEKPRTSDDWLMNSGSLFGEIEAVRELTVDDVHQRVDLQRLELLVRERIAYANLTIDLYRTQGVEAAARELNSMTGPNLTERIHAVLLDMLTEEYSMFRAREETEKTRWRRNEILLGGGLFAFYLGLLATVWFAARNRKRRLRVEGTLHEREVLIGAIMDGGKHAIYASDKNGVITLFNQATERLLGYAASDFVGKHISEMMGKVYDPVELEEFARQVGRRLGRPVGVSEVCRVALEEAGTFEHEWTAFRKDGGKVAISLTVNTLKDEAGEVYGYLSIAQDISVRKDVERAKNEFISTVSHELRTPLTSIRGSLGLVASGSLGELPQKAGELVAIAHKNSERLVLIINDILDVEKIESGKFLMRIRSVEVASLLAQALESHQGYTEKYGVRFVLKNVPRRSWVSADPERLMQVLANLLSNAAKFSPRGSEVWIGARPDFRDGRVYFSIQDFGPGIPEEFHASVFEKFAQADTSDTRRHEGTGLGLSIARKLLEGMDGSISFETEKGKGTVFFFDLPQAAG